MSKTKLETPHDPKTGEILSDPRPGADLAYYRETSAQDLYLDDQGREVLDPRSMAPPVGYKKQPSMVDTIREQIRSAQLAQEAEAQGLETFDEADDFDVNDDFDHSSPYEEIFDPAPPQARYFTAEEQMGFGFSAPGVQRRKPSTEPGPLPDDDPPSDGPRPPASQTPAPVAPQATPTPVAKPGE